LLIELAIEAEKGRSQDMSEESQDCLISQEMTTYLIFYIEILDALIMFCCKDEGHAAYHHFKYGIPSTEEYNTWRCQVKNLCNKYQSNIHHHKF
jgi:hypothetical protein